MSISPVCEEAQLSECIEFKYSDIQIATNYFDKSLVIGEGGFGKVYKGNITVGQNRDKLVVAIKHLKLSSHQGEREFLAEIGVQAKLRHTNLVSLIGYCKHEEQEMFIVLEYISKGSLEDRLLRQEYTPLTLVRRLKILIATARGLNHLHNGTGLKHGVIHRDMKPANILLDDNWVAKICDFGISKSGPPEQTSNYIRGTPGRVDPAYFISGVPTQKSDVYMFGVVMLEVLCGRRAIDESFADPNQRVLKEWAQECFRVNTLAQIVDTNLLQGAGAILTTCLDKFVQLAMLCFLDKIDERPTMADVVVGLETILAAQEKANRKGIKAMKNKIYGGKKLLSFLTPLKREKNPVGSTSLKSLEFHLYTVGGENRILHQFDIDTINTASDNFSIANRISYEDVGTMHKGKLENGKTIAIFQTSDETQYELYKNETSILVNVEHENLIQLHGYCIDGTKVYLVYNCAPYETLDRLISGRSSAPFEWNQRCKILQGVSRVLRYLHCHAAVRVMHFDVKPGKIMLDKSMNPKLFGFYSARSIAMKEADCIKIDVAHRITGCLAPEYICTDTDCVLSTKCDVFSFGVLVLETVTAERILESSTETVDFLEFNVRRKWWKGAYSNKAESEMMKRFIMVGLLCIQIDATHRPGMEEVVGMLMGTSSPDALLSEIKAMNTQEWELRNKTIKSNSACSAEASTSASLP